MKFLDYFILTLIFLSTFFYFFHTQEKRATYLYLETPKATNTYVMDTNKKITNVGQLGKFAISISNNKVTLNFLSYQTKISIQQESVQKMGRSILSVSNLLREYGVSTNYKKHHKSEIKKISVSDTMEEKTR